MISKKDFEKIFRQHYSLLYRIAKGYIKSEYLAEEIVCETFIKLWNKPVDIKVSLKDYLTKTLINTCIDYYRKEKARKDKEISIEDNVIVCTTLADLNEDPLDYIINDEQEKIVIEAIETLPPRYKMTLWLFRFDNLSYEEIAQEMGISKNTVKSNLQAAMNLLREKLKDVILVILSFFFVG